MWNELISALLLQSGHNATVATLGAALLGVAAGSAGTFLYLRKRTLVSDALAHATLPGVGLAFIVMVLFGGDGRSLLGLLLGSALSAALGLVMVDWLARRTRLPQDAAIGAVLSVFFGFGIVLLTIIQTLPSGRQAGLEGFLLGATAGMLFSDAVVIAVSAALVIGLLALLRRPMTLVAFDAEFAQASGIPVRATDLAIMGLVMAVTVIGLKIVGLVLIVALLVIPAVTARFWTERTEGVLWGAGVVGGISGYLGTAVSATAPSLPAGPIVVLVATALFAISLFFAPARGVLAALLRHRRLQLRVHRRQGLLALARGEPIHDRLTLAVLRREGLIRADRVATPEGQAQAGKALLDERRWEIVRALHADEALAGRYDRLAPIETLLTPDELAAVDARLERPALIGG